MKKQAVRIPTHGLTALTCDGTISVPKEYAGMMELADMQDLGDVTSVK